MLIKYILVFLVSMVPLIELRGAVPLGLSPWMGGAIPTIIGKFFTFCYEKGEKGGKKLQEKAGRGLYFALFLFVGIPLPGTGAWTGTLAASFLDMDFKKSIVAVMAGVVLAGIIMGLAAAGAFGAAGALIR